MCGIAGYAGWPRTADASRSDLERMCGAIRHRGPDDEGHFIAPGVALGMRRLSIIDVGGGHQPIGNEDGSVQIVFNGEIYNHHEVRRELVARGHRFRTSSDTEVIVHGYEEYGDRVVDHLAGMFAFAIWDSKRRRLFVARDRLGIKPLFYWPHAGGVAFASELHCFRALEHFPRNVAPEAIAQYFAFGYVPDPLAVFEGVVKLLPGHTLSWSPGVPIEINRYWTPSREERAALTEQDALEELDGLLKLCVESHLESEVPLGAFLSGGIDSSTVVAYMAKAMNRKVQTFSIGFEEKEFNEAPDAALVAKALGTQHTELIVRPDADTLVDLVATAFDEPFADSSALPTYLVSRLARQHVTVALSGDGGDELFGGYSRYLEILGRREVQPAVLRAALRLGARQLPHGAFGRNRLLDLGRSRRGRYAATVANATATSEGGIANRDLASMSGSLDGLLAPWFEQAAQRDFPTQMTIVDLMTYLPGDILTKVDRMSMAVSLEARVPLLDHRLVEFAVSLPSHLKMRDGTGKWLLRRGIEKLLPSRVLTKPKQGFAVPLGKWLRGPLRHRLEAVIAPGARVAPWIDTKALTRIANEHLRERRDHSGRLWQAIVLDLWLEKLASPAAVSIPPRQEIRRRA